MQVPEKYQFVLAKKPGRVWLYESKSERER